MVPAGLVFAVFGALLIWRRKRWAGENIAFRSRFRSRWMRYGLDRADFDPQRLGELQAAAAGGVSILLGIGLVLYGLLT